jgi:hypothetical protein
MKILLSFLAMLVAVHYSFAQTNTFPDNGNVGIGTTSPQEKLEVTGNQKLFGDLLFGSHQTAYYIHALGNGGAIRLRSNITTAVDRNVQFGNIDNNGLWNSFMIVDQTGNVGIGTINPNGKLDVNGAILLPGSSSNAMLRSVIGTARIPGEISGYSGAGIAMDDGFLRLSAGGGTSSATKTFIDLSGFSLSPELKQNLTLGTSGTERMRIDKDGNVGIGTTTPDAKLTVNGSIHSTEVKVTATVPADFVFEKSYALKTLSEVNVYIQKNKHLPDVPSGNAMKENGINLSEFNMKLLQKLEELTLYLIEKDKEIKQQSKVNGQLRNDVQRLKIQMTALTQSLKSLK